MFEYLGLPENYEPGYRVSCRKVYQKGNITYGYNPGKRKWLVVLFGDYRRSFFCNKDEVKHFLEHEIPLEFIPLEEKVEIQKEKLVIDSFGNAFNGFDFNNEPTEPLKSNPPVTYQGDPTGLTFLAYSPGTGLFLAEKEIRIFRDQLTNEMIPEKSAWRESVYGRYITIAARRFKNDTIYVENLDTYIHILDKRYKILEVEGEDTTLAFTLDYVEDNPELFGECCQTDTLCLRENMYYVEDVGDVSYSWMANYSFYCCGCDRTYLTERRSPEDRDYCIECRPAGVSSLLHEYSTRAEIAIGFIDKNGNIGKENTNSRYFGLELEFECSDDSATELIEELHERKLGVACRDGSLDWGFEIKTPPVDSRYIRTYLKQLSDLLNKHSFSYSAEESCGYHIHVTRRGLSERQIERIFLFIHEEDNRDFMEDIARRSCDTHYCKFNDDAENFLRLEKDYIVTPAAGKVPKHRFNNRSDRYQAVNLLKAPTVEFRLFAGTSNKEEMFMSLEFVMALLDFTSPARGIKGVDYNDFISFLEIAGGSKAYPNLTSYLIKMGYMTKKAIPTTFKKGN